MRRAKQKDHTLEDVVAFVREALRTGKDFHVGIDPGVTGAIGMIHDKDHVVIDIPVFQVDRKRTVTAQDGGSKVVDAKASAFDHEAILDIFAELDEAHEQMHVAVEIAQVMISGKRFAEGGGKGKKGGGNARTAYMTGMGYGMWPLFLKSLGLASFREWTPSDWKKEFKLSGKGKDVSRQMAKSLFPKAPLGRVSDHNRAEALLLAECCRLRRARGASGG